MQILSGRLKNRKILSSAGGKTRPTTSQVRESFFNICQNDIENASFLDLFGGSGAMGIEALSRGASFTTIIEKNRAAYSAIKQNIQRLQLGHRTCLKCMDAVTFLKNCPDESSLFSHVYIDPPYQLLAEMGNQRLLLSQKVLYIIDDRALFSKARIFVETSKENAPLFQNFQRFALKKTRRYGTSCLLEYSHGHFDE